MFYNRPTLDSYKLDFEFHHEKNQQSFPYLLLLNEKIPEVFSKIKILLSCQVQICRVFKSISGIGNSDRNSQRVILKEARVILFNIMN